MKYQKFFYHVFYPKSVVLVGASREKTKLGYLFLQSLVDAKFQGKIYLVNPNVNEILGIRTYRSVKDIPEKDIDLIIITVKRDFVPQIVKECVNKKVKAAVVNTSGFSESGDEYGKKLEKEILRLAKTGGLRIIGPNCMGVYCFNGKIAFPPFVPVKKGFVSFISQSGSIATMFQVLCSEREIGLSKVISSGNEIDLNCVDFLEYFDEDEETKIISAYIESVKNGRRFLEVTRKIIGRKPIILWKSGLTKLGSTTAKSHTGAITGSENVWKAVLKQTGIIPADNLEELIDLTLIFDYIPKLRGDRLAIISSPGGLAVSASDACEIYNVKLAKLSGKTREKLREILPPYGTGLSNPIDIGVSSINEEIYGKVVDILAEDPNVDNILVIGGAPIGGNKLLLLEETATQLVKTVEKLKEKKPVLVVLPPISRATKALKLLHNARIPTYPSVERAIKSLSKRITYWLRFHV